MGRNDKMRLNFEFMLHDDRALHKKLWDIAALV